MEKINRIKNPLKRIAQKGAAFLLWVVLAGSLFSCGKNSEGEVHGFCVKEIDVKVHIGVAMVTEISPRCR